MKNNIQNMDIKRKVLNGIIIVLALILIGRIAYTIKAFSEIYNEDYLESHLLYRLKDEDFGSMVLTYHSNVAQGFGDKKELQDYHAIAEYYEAAAYYKMYMEAGDLERAEREKIKMDQSAGGFGELYFVKDKIDKRLNIAE